MPAQDAKFPEIFRIVLWKNDQRGGVAVESPAHVAVFEALPDRRDVPEADDRAVGFAEDRDAAELLGGTPSSVTISY